MFPAPYHHIKHKAPENDSNCMYNWKTDLTQLIMAQCCNPMQGKEVTVNRRENKRTQVRQKMHNQNAIESGFLFIFSMTTDIHIYAHHKGIGKIHTFFC